MLPSICTLCLLSALRENRFICLYRADRSGEGVDVSGRSSEGDGLIVGDGDGKLNTGRGGVGVFVDGSCCGSIVFGHATGWIQGRSPPRIQAQMIPSTQV